MLYSKKQERSRRFRLALRMGIPILLLMSILIFYVIRQKNFAFTSLEIALFATIAYIAVYFIFFLINLGQNETYVDRLTDAFNRDALLKTLKKGDFKTLVLLRIDNLPYINDHHGIDRGDKLLKTLVLFLDQHLQSYGIKEPVVGRYHGGDFIVALHLREEESVAVFEEFSANHKEINGISIEIKYAAVSIEKKTDPSDVITHLYDTISLQKGEKPTQKRANEERLDITLLEKEIVEAIEKRAIYLLFFPIKNLLNDTVDFFEVAVRLDTETNGLLMPKKFIPVVNRLGLERAFDEALFTTLCKVAKEVRNDIRFTFRLSPISMRYEGFCEKLAQIATYHHLTASRFDFQIYENRPYKDITRYKVIIEEIKEFGFTVSLENFGAVNASVEYLKKLPVDMVQFDKEFTVGFSNPRQNALLKGYLQTCRTLGVKTLMRWVDNEELLQAFKQIGIDYAQGFAVSNRSLTSEILISRYGVKS